jgi:hypothetical protein
MSPVIPAVIDHKNIGPLLAAVSAEPYFQCGVSVLYNPDAWYWRPVILEVPTGELAEDGMKTLALVGVGGNYETCALTGREGFAAQGLEGKVRIRKPLFNALMNLRDLIMAHRGRIVRA